MKTVKKMLEEMGLSRTQSRLRYRVTFKGTSHKSESGAAAKVQADGARVSVQTDTGPGMDTDARSSHSCVRQEAEPFRKRC